MALGQTLDPTAGAMGFPMLLVACLPWLSVRPFYRAATTVAAASCLWEMGLALEPPRSPAHPPRNCCPPPQNIFKLAIHVTDTVCCQVCPSSHSWQIALANALSALLLIALFAQILTMVDTRRYACLIPAGAWPAHTTVSYDFCIYKHAARCVS